MLKRLFHHPTFVWDQANHRFPPERFPAVPHGADFPEHNQQGARVAPMIHSTAFANADMVNVVCYSRILQRGLSVIKKNGQFAERYWQIAKIVGWW